MIRKPCVTDLGGASPFPDQRLLEADQGFLESDQRLLKFDCRLAVLDDDRLDRQPAHSLANFGIAQFLRALLALLILFFLRGIGFPPLQLSREKPP